MKVDPRFLAGDGPDVFTGNELLLKGALETDGGVHLLGGYPGSPVSGFFDSLALIKDLLNEKGIRAVINNNEALAAAMLNGSQVAGCRGMIVMKSVGVHVAADALALGNLAGADPAGGAIVVYGDDPWSDSTQVAADSRYISKHLFIPTLEPSTPPEVKDFVNLAFKISAASELYMGYMLTNNLADGGGSVICRPNQYPSLTTHQKMSLETDAINLDKYVLLPPRTWWQEANMAERQARAVREASRLGLNRIDYPSEVRKGFGFVASGLAHAYLLQAMSEMELLGEFPILKFGMSYPIDAELVEQFADRCERIVVVEERRGFMEEQICEVILQARQAGRPSGQTEVWGKKFPGGADGIPSIRGLHPSIIIERLTELLKRVEVAGAKITVPQTLQREFETIEATGQRDVGKLPPRIPTFCPGCPHRDTSSLCLQIKKRFMDPVYMAKTHGCGPVDLMFHGDTGCYTMLMFPPTTPLMHDYSGMGLGGGTGSGTDPFITNKQVVFMGDSTFFHSGQIAISQAIKLGQDITFIILDNRTTAMTGHQPTPGVEYDVVGMTTPVQDIERIVRSMDLTGEALIARVDPERREEYGQLLAETFLADGVKIIIADKECGITRMRRKRRMERTIIRRDGFLPAWRHMNINHEICRFCLACTEITGCPGLKHVQTPYGPKMDTDLTWCVDDGACERIGACSALERVTIKRKATPRSRVPELGLDDIPEPQKRPLAGLWRCCIAGVGGMGCGVATTILVRAGHKEGYDVLFLDKKGLAIRSGGIVSQVAYNVSGKPTTAIVPYGKADLLIGLDILEAARTIDPTGRARIASPDRTAAVVNTDKTATIPELLSGQEYFDPDELEQIIRNNTSSDDFLARNISRICEKYLGSKIYANIMMLGFAFQKGMIPVSMHSMAWAIKDTIRADLRKNLYAFNMGRKLVVQPDLFLGAPKRATWKKELEEKCRCTVRRYRKGQEISEALREMSARVMETASELEETDKQAIVVRLYDLLRWGGPDYALRYAQAVAGTYKKDTADFAFAATRAVICNLADAMLIKDGVFLAELSTSHEKYARDREKYDVNTANGDKISYRHLWHWKMKIGPWEWNMSMTVYDWMLHILKRSRYLRKLLPGWHKDKYEFLRKYEGVVAEFAYTTDEEYQRQLVKLSSAQCMDCSVPRCREEACPLESQIPQWVELARGERWREAAEKLFETNNFPEITSRICPAFCESACKRNFGGFAVGIRDIERQIADRAVREGWIVPAPAAEKTGKTVAVVGSGPAGLAAAQQLARAGHDVTVFEAEAHAGGLMRYGIPPWRLEAELIDRRVEQLSAEGVKFRTSVEIGKDISAAELKKQFDAVLLAVGAAQPKDLKIPGREMRGVRFGIEFLRNGNIGGTGSKAVPPVINVKNKVVAVIGGGLTGDDCVEVAIAQGAKEVHQLEILPALVKTENLLQTGVSEQPNVHRRWCVSTKAFGGDGNLTSLEAVQVAWKPSTKGPVIEAVPGSDFRLNVDVALLAMGFDPVVPKSIAEQLNLATDERGGILTKSFATGVSGVFAAGDLVTGPSYVATSIASGRKAAEKINEYLAKVAIGAVETRPATIPASN